VVGLLCLTTLANFVDPLITGKIGAITVRVEIYPAARLSVIGWFWFQGSVFSAAWNPNNAPLGEAITASIPLTLWAFLGMESAAANSDAVENPKRNVPLACLFGTGGAAVVYILSTTVIQGIVPNAELAASTAPFALVYAKMFTPWVGNVILVLAVAACLGSLLGWQFTLAQVSKAAAEQRMFPKFFAKVTAADAPIVGMVVAGGLQTAMAVSTMSPDATAQFGKLVSLAAVTNLIPYVTSLSALMIIMRKSKVEDSLFNRNVAVLMVAMLYSFYALYASGKDAVFGAMIVMAIGYLIFGFIAFRFDGEAKAAGAVAAKA